MKQDYKFVKKCIQNVWPELEWIWINDTVLWLPTIIEVKDLVNKIDAKSLEFYEYLFDCDDFALQVSAAVSLKRGTSDNLPIGSHFPWPFGQITGVEFKHLKEIHTMNICVCNDSSVILIEPQTDEIRIADSKLDKPFFVKIP